MDSPKDVDSPGGEKKMKITVSSVMQGVKDTVFEVTEKHTVQALKLKIEEKTEVLADRQILLFKGKELKDNSRSMAECGIQGDAHLTMNIKMSTGLFANPTTTDMVLMMPPVFLSNQDQLRKQIKGMSSVHRKPKKMSGIDETAKIWTPEKQMEHELTRNRMKGLLRRKKTPILSGGTTPVDSEAGSVQSLSPVATPPSELSATSSLSQSATTSASSSKSIDNDEPTEKELKLFFDPAESVEEYKRRRRSMFLPPSNEQELLDYVKTFEEERKTKCNTCFKKLSAAQQTMRCKCARIFCDRHRAPANHTCGIDYKQDGRIKLKKQTSRAGDGGAHKARFESDEEEKKKKKSK